MFETKITEMLNVKYPIIGGTMMWITNPEFVATISNAGGLGILASAIYESKDEFEKAIDTIFDLTDKPFGVNINLFPAMRAIDNNEYVDVMVKKGVKIVETSGHSAPVELCNRFKDAGITWIHKCVGVRYALKVQKMGADIVTIVGYENGGATGKLDIGTMALVPAVIDALEIPVIGGGGISDGRGLVAILALGAEGVIIGTRLLATQECPIHDNLKQALLNASEIDTMLIMRSINSTHRVWVNEAAQKCADLESQGADLGNILNVVSGENAKEMFDNGNLGKGIISCGQGIGTIHDIPTVKDLFDKMISDANDVVLKIKNK